MLAPVDASGWLQHSGVCQEVVAEGVYHLDSSHPTRQWKDACGTWRPPGQRATHVLHAERAVQWSQSLRRCNLGADAILAQMPLLSRSVVPWAHSLGPQTAAACMRFVENVSHATGRMPAVAKERSDEALFCSHHLPCLTSFYHRSTQ